MSTYGSFYAAETIGFPVTIGEISFYVQSWQINAQRVFSEQPAADGACVITNSSQKGRRLVLEGIWVTDSAPDSLILQLDGCIEHGESFSFTLRELVFSDARLMKYSAEEKGDEPYVKLRLELFCTSAPKEADAV